MSGVVVFDADKFLAQYPELKKTASESFTWHDQAQGWFRQAELMVNNTPCSIVKDLAEREVLLFLLVRHFVALYDRAIQGGLVGRISSASEGSVSVSAEMPSNTASAAWYNQTPFGASYWQLTAKYRRFCYVPGGHYAGLW